jgi:gluconolactonase
MTDKIFFDAGGIEAPGVPDGMKVDKAGNIFATGPGGVLIISADGEHLGTISTGEITANVGWGGAAPGDPCGSNTLYMTATSSLYSIEVLTGGCSPGK